MALLLRPLPVPSALGRQRPSSEASRKLTPLRAMLPKDLRSFDDVRFSIRLKRRVSFRFSRRHCAQPMRRTVSLPPRVGGGGKGGALDSQARLFGPAIFESKKLQVLHFNDPEHPAAAPSSTPRTYTLTHSDVTAKLTLAVAHHINKSQVMGWYQRVLRDEVIAVWKHHCRCQVESSSQASALPGTCSRRGADAPLPEGATCETVLHVHCHISGAHLFLEMIAPQRNHIFRRELPVVLDAFRHGDRALFEMFPELENSLVYVHFHSNVPRFNTHECWGTLKDAPKIGAEKARELEEVAAREHSKWPIA